MYFFIFNTKGGEIVCFFFICLFFLILLHCHAIHESRPYKQHAINTSSVALKKKTTNDKTSKQKNLKQVHQLTFSFSANYERQKPRGNWVFSVKLSTKCLVHCVLWPCFTEGLFFFWKILETLWNILKYQFVITCFSSYLQLQESNTDRQLIETSPVLQKLTEFEEAIGVIFTHVRLLARAFTLRTVGFNHLTLWVCGKGPLRALWVYS